MARRNVTDLINLMKHGLGRIPDSRHRLIDTLNDAGRALFHVAEQGPWFHQWNWLVRDNVDFTLPGGSVEEVELPADFGSLVAINKADTLVGGIQQISAAKLSLLRRSVSVTQLRSYICFEVGSTQATGDATPRKVAAFWPPRTDALTGLTLTYVRAWVDLVESDGQRIPDIPQIFDRLLMLMARAYAIHLEDQAEAAEDPLVVNEINRLVQHEATMQPNFGRPTHSVMARAHSGLASHPWYGQRIIRPEVP